MQPRVLPDPPVRLDLPDRPRLPDPRGRPVLPDFLDLELVSAADYNITAEVILYRDGTLLNIKQLNRSGATAGTEIIPLLALMLIPLLLQEL